MKIKCTFKEIKMPNFPASWDGYGCEVEEDWSKKTERYSRVTKIEGDHETGRGNNDVEGMIVSYADFIPLNLGSHFPQLTALSCDNLKCISRRELVGLENLTTISFMGAQIETLPDDLFADLKNLTTVVFELGSLKYLSSKLFDPIIQNDIKLINLSKNDGISAVYCKESFFAPAGAIETDSKQHFMKIIDESCRKPEPVAQFTLQSLCEEAVSRNLNPINANEVYVLGRAYRSDYLEQQALDTMVIKPGISTTTTNFGALRRFFECNRELTPTKDFEC